VSTCRLAGVSHPTWTGTCPARTQWHENRNAVIWSRRRLAGTGRDCDYRACVGGPSPERLMAMPVGNVFFQAAADNAGASIKGLRPWPWRGEGFAAAPAAGEQTPHERRPWQNTTASASAARCVRPADPARHRKAVCPNGADASQPSTAGAPAGIGQMARARNQASELSPYRFQLRGDLDRSRMLSVGLRLLSNPPGPGRRRRINSVPCRRGTVQGSCR